ncbi:hypothetical protein GVX76_08210 [[Haemophilus] felis]|nr:hypothetical protein [[Haemophilus] felis]
MITVPIPNLNDSLLEVELDDEIFFLHFSWNSTGEFWTMAIENAYNDEILTGVKLLPDRFLLQQFNEETLPLGDFIVVREDEQQAVGREDFFAKRAVLIYVGVDDEL